MKLKITLLRAFLSVIVVMLFSVAQAQTARVTGRVMADDDKLPLPGVTIQVKGKTTSVQTATDGTYAIQAGKEDILVFRFI